MCTLIVLDRVVPGVPLVVASNRDEYYSRSAAPPARVDPDEEGSPAYVAPQDLQAGGTWMGVNALGLFVGLTNRRAEVSGPGRRSRGLLVSDALRRDGAAAVAEELRGQMTTAEGGLTATYSPFYMLFADGRETGLAVVHGDGGVPHASLEMLPPGRHVIGNRPSSPKLDGIRRAVDEIDLDAPPAAIRDALAAVLASHPQPDHPLENPCVHTPDYGTRSSSLLALGERRWRYWHGEGAPCETKYANLSRLLEEIR